MLTNWFIVTYIPYLSNLFTIIYMRICSDNSFEGNWLTSYGAGQHDNA